MTRITPADENSCGTLMDTGSAIEVSSDNSDLRRVWICHTFSNRIDSRITSSMNKTRRSFSELLSDHSR